jgi:uncharacterized protein YdaU (DUF1376 family)
MGDFQADTMALSMMEQGAYDRLLDYYYATEKPIPLNSDRAAIICRAVSMEERAAVEMVLDTYFVRSLDGWRNVRADKEIALSQARSGGAAAAGKLGAEARWNSNLNSKSDGNSDGKRHSNSHSKDRSNEDDSPTTNHQIKTKPKPLSGDEDYSGDFVRFWETWPKSKRKLGKFKSWEVWRTKKLDSLASEIIAHVEAMKTSEQWRSGYDPMPITYLNGRRWDDGPPEDPGPRLAV